MIKNEYKHAKRRVKRLSKSKSHSLASLRSECERKKWFFFNGRENIPDGTIHQAALDCGLKVYV